MHQGALKLERLNLGDSKEKSALSPCICQYRKPPTISPGLICFCKQFLMGLYKGGGGLIYGWAYTWTIFCVSNKQVRHKQVSHKQGNKRVLSSEYITGLILIGGLIFGWAYIRGGAYIRNEVSVSTCGGLIHGGLYSGGLIVGGLRYTRIFMIYDIICIIYSN